MLHMANQICSLCNIYYTVFLLLTELLPSADFSVESNSAVEKWEQVKCHDLTAVKSILYMSNSYALPFQDIT